MLILACIQISKVCSVNKVNCFRAAGYKATVEANFYWTSALYDTNNISRRTAAAPLCNSNIKIDKRSSAYKPT